MRRAIASAMVLLFILTALTFSSGPSISETTHVLYDDRNLAISDGRVVIPPGGGFSTDYYLKVARDVPVSSMTMSISTDDVANGSALEEPYLDMGPDGVADWKYSGTGYGKFGEQTTLSDGADKRTMSYGSSGGVNSENAILIPENSEILDVSMDMKGRFIPRTLGQYTIQADSASVSLYGYAMDHGDIDGDGYEDVVVSDIKNSRILWFKNPNNPNATDWTYSVAYSGSSASNCYSLDLGDIDGDGDIDIAITSYTNGHVSYLRNNNNGYSFTRYTFYTAFRYAGAVRIADINQDGNPDFVVGSYYYYYYYSSRYLYWFRAPSDPNSTSGWGAYSITSSPYYYCYPYLSMDVGDFNDDGYPDVAMGVWYYYSVNSVYVYLAPNSTSSSWSSKVADSSSNQPFYLSTGDINGDEFDDIVVGTRGNNELSLLYTTNYGKDWTERSIDSSANYPNVIEIDDMDADGKSDIIMGCGSGTYEVRLYEQGSSINSWTRSTLTSQIQTPYAVAIYDYDGDSDLDIMVSGTYGSQIVLLKCTSKTLLTYSLLWLEDGGIKNIYAMDMADIDDDGDKDMVFIGRDTGYVGWWENDGQPFDAPGELHKIGGLGSPMDVWWGNVDGDDDLDVVAISSGGAAYWYENLGDPEGEWIQRTIFTGIGSIYDTWVGDLTGDGKVDVAYVIYNYNNGRVAFHYAPNDPKTQSWSQHTVGNGLSYLTAIVGDDMDNDGDNDLVVCGGTYRSGFITMLRNPVPNPTAGLWATVSVAAGLSYPIDVDTFDISDDGYKDVISTERYYSSYGCSVKWFQNPRTGTGWKSYTVATTDFNWYLAVDDIGNDGYADIVYSRGSTSSPSQIIWVEEPDSYTSTWVNHNLGSYSGTRDLDMADLNLDGLVDILSTSTSNDRTTSWKMDVAYPKNVALDIGNDESTWDFGLSGNLTTTRTLFGTEMVNALQDVIDSKPLQVTRFSDGYGIPMMSIPLEIRSETLGKISIENIWIRYEVKVMIEHDADGNPLGDVLERMIPKYGGDSSDPYTRVYILVSARNGGKVVIGDVAVEFNAKPRQIQNLPDVALNEDSVKEFNHDLSAYFTDDYTLPQDISFAIKLEGTQKDKVSARVVGQHIVVDATIVQNFFTRSPYDITGRILATDTGGPNGVPPRTFVSESFSISVNRVNDPPVATGESLGDLIAFEGKTTTVAWLDGENLFMDVDGDEIRYDPVPDLTVQGYDPASELTIRWIRSNNTLEVSLSPYSDWTGSVPVTLYGYDLDEPDYVNNPSIDLTLHVRNVNDPPFWSPIEDVSSKEGESDPYLLRLDDFVQDHDTPLSELTFEINGYSNTSFIYLRLREKDGHTYIGIDPRVPEWFGMTKVSVSVSDGEFVSNIWFFITIEPVNDMPSLLIKNPQDGSTFGSGSLSVIGEAYDIEGILWVEVFYDGVWYRAKGTTFWGITLTIPRVEKDTKDVPILVRAYDGEYFANGTVMINIEKYVPPVDLDWDKDGHLNDFDDFPYDPSEWIDSDDDGIGDNADSFPKIKTLSVDSDKDGYGDEVDSHPFDPELWNDRNGNGINEEDEDRFQTTTTDTGGSEGVESILPVLLWALVFVMLIVAALSAFSYFHKRSASRDPVRSVKYMSRLNKRREFLHNIGEKLPFVHASNKLEEMVSGRSTGSAKPINPYMGPMPGRPTVPGPALIRTLPPAPTQSLTPVQHPQYKKP